MQIQPVCAPAPSEAAEQHTHSHRRQIALRVEPRRWVSCTLACVCTWSWNFRHTHACLIFSLCPLLQHTFMLFVLPSIPPPNSLAHPQLYSVLSDLWICVKTVTTRCWRCCCCLSCVLISGPTEEEFRTSYAMGNWKTWSNHFFQHFHRQILAFPRVWNLLRFLKWQTARKQKTMRTKLYLLTAHLFLLGVFLFVVDSKGTFYGGQINPFFGHRYHLYKAGVNPQHSPNKPMTRHK